jgi:hypothetical protein
VKLINGMASRSVAPSKLAHRHSSFSRAGLDVTLQRAWIARPEINQCSLGSAQRVRAEKACSALEIHLLTSQPRRLAKRNHPVFPLVHTTKLVMPSGAAQLPDDRSGSGAAVIAS